VRTSPWTWGRHDRALLFLSEGISDQGLVPHIEDIAEEAGAGVVVNAPDLRWLDHHAGHSVAQKLRAAKRLGEGYKLIVLQRDADRQPPQDRRDEMESAVAGEWPEVPHVPVVPVRMLEAWLPLDEAAIREVAGNPQGRMPLDLPGPSAVERIADPKQVLKNTLAKASGCTGRRLAGLQKRFPHNRHRLLELLDRNGPVSRVPSWRAFAGDLVSALQKIS
jgi:hypothetical protein